MKNNPEDQGKTAEETQPSAFYSIPKSLEMEKKKKILYLFERLGYNSTSSKAVSDTNLFCHSYFVLTVTHSHQKRPIQISNSRFIYLRAHVLGPLFRTKYCTSQGISHNRFGKLERQIEGDDVA